MNKEINQTCQKINHQDILNKEFYPVWFFTNERANSFLGKLEGDREIKKVFAIGGSGDFAFSLLSSKNLRVDEINVCDIRQMAGVSIDFKIALFKKLSYEEILDLFLKRKVFDKTAIYSKIKETIAPSSKIFFDFIIENHKEDDFLKCLKKSGLWYKDSFWQIKNKTKYLLYLTSEERYQSLQDDLDKITIYCGEFNENLKLFQDDYYDLIYASNILDSRKYCRDPHSYLQTIKNKLSENGLLFVVVQNNPGRMIKLMEEKGFSLYQREIHKFNIIASLLGHYCYSFLLFTKIR